MILLRPFALALLGCAFCLGLEGAPLWAQAPLSAFGDDGELVEVVSGTYQELFGDGSEALPESPVLALEIVRPGDEVVRLLVPGTEGPEIDEASALISEGGQHFVLWSAHLEAGVATALELIGFDGEMWTDLIEISGDPSLVKGPPRLALTRDAYGSSVLSEPRTVVHVVWWEETAEGTAVRFTPVVFVNGRYMGWNPVVDLGSFDSNPPVEPSSPPSALELAATLESGADVRSVVAAIPRRASSRLLTMQMRVLPSSLTRLAGDIRAHIVGIGREANGRESMLRMADSIRAHIVGIGRMHAGVRDYIAEKTYAALLAYGASYTPEESEQLGDLGWLSIIESGASILGNGLRESGLPCSILYLGSDPLQMVGSDHQVELCLMSDRPAPETEPDRNHSILLSETGEEALVVWEGDDATLLYRETEGEGWGDVRSVNTGGSVTREKALSLLRQSVRVQ